MVSKDELPRAQTNEDTYKFAGWFTYVQRDRDGIVPEFPLGSVANELVCAERTQTLATIQMGLVNKEVLHKTGTNFSNVPKTDTTPIPFHPMAGGYPYDACVFVDNDTVIVPGLGDIAALDQLRPWRRDKWKETFEMEGEGGIVMQVGKLDGKRYILDPHTMTAITPAFSYDEVIANDREMIIAINSNDTNDTKRYKLSAVNHIQGGLNRPTAGPEYDHYPAFLLAKQLRIDRLTTSGELVYKPKHVVSQIAKGDLFGLEQPTFGAEAYGREAFGNAFSQVIEYARIDKDFRKVFRQPDSVAALPRVTSPLINAQLFLHTDSDGASMIRLVSDSGAELSLRQRTNGGVVLCNAHAEQIITCDDAEYVPYIDKTTEIINDYFVRLYQLDPTKIHELRQKLGKSGVSGWLATRQLRAELQKRGEV